MEITTANISVGQLSFQSKYEDEFKITNYLRCTPTSSRYLTYLVFTCWKSYLYYPMVFLVKRRITKVKYLPRYFPCMVYVTNWEYGSGQVLNVPSM